MSARDSVPGRLLPTVRIGARERQVGRPRGVPYRLSSKRLDQIAGYRGRYLEWSVPSDMIVTGDADFEGCDVEPSNGHRDFVSWLGDGYGERYQQVAGQIDRLGVLDVDGQRLVVDATYSPGTSQADRYELALIVRSLRVADPAM